MPKCFAFFARLLPIFLFSLWRYKTRSKAWHMKQFLCFMLSSPCDLDIGVTLYVVEEAGRLGVKNLWLQPGSENDEVSGQVFGGSTLTRPRPQPVGV